MRFVFAFPFVLLLASWAPLIPGYSWNAVRIVGGGYTPGLVAHPSEPGLIYARTDIGSVYRWNQPAGLWTPLTDFQSPANYNLNGPESIALDPTDADRLYIAAGMYTCNGCAFAILASTDRGATFSTYPVPFQMGANNDGRSSGERLAVNPFHPNQLLMGTRKDGLWGSSDQGRSWAAVSGFPVTSSPDGLGVQWVTFDPANAGVVYAGAYTTASVYRSSDEGVTWQPLPNQPAWPFPVSNGTRAPAAGRAVVNPDGNLYLVYGDFPGPNNMNYGFVAKFNAESATWAIITPPLDKAGGETSQRGGFSGLTQDLQHPGTIAVSTLDRWYPVDTVYLTRDGGNTWTDLARTASLAGPSALNGGNYYFDPSVFASHAPWLNFGGGGTPRGSARFGWWISALLIDPSNPEHLLFGTGATIYATRNLSAGTPTWEVEATGIEETAVTALISPSQGAHLLSGVGDIGGFRHDDFAVSPVAGMYTNPVATTVNSLDWAGEKPEVIVRTQNPGASSTTPCNYGALSGDGGSTWSPLAACAAGASNGGGSMAVDASGEMLMWTASRPQYSLDRGATWADTGLTTRVPVASDKVTPRRFYAFFSGTFYSTMESGGTRFSAANRTPLPSGNCGGTRCTPVASFGEAGELWLPLGSAGLYHSSDSGVTWAKLASVTTANAIAVGAPGPRSSTPSLFLFGNQPNAIYRSDDAGATWLRINDDQHQYGGPTLIAADPRLYGRVYLGMNGRGIIYGDLVRPRR